MNVRLHSRRAPGTLPGSRGRSPLPLAGARPGFRPVRAFTLMEIMLALATSAIVLAGIGGVFFSAMRLRERTIAAVDESLTLHHALGQLRRDLVCALPPGTMLAGDFKTGLSGNLGLGLSYWAQFSTATGVINENMPWGDVQEVIYEVRGASSGSRGAELIRTVSRNLLTTTQLDEQEQVLLEGVEDFEISCFDGIQWVDSWDTSVSESNLPSAVRIRIQLAATDEQDRREREPVEMVIPLLSQASQTSLGESETEEAQQ